MSSTYPQLLRAADKRHSAHVEQMYLAGDAHNAPVRSEVWRRNVRIGDFTGAAATSQALNLFTGLTATALARPGQSGDFPANAWINTAMGPYIRRITDFSGGSSTAVSVQLGDAGDPNGLLTTTSVFTGVGAGISWTPAAAEYARRPEDAYAPILTITSDVNIAALTAGELEVVIPYVAFLRDL